MKFSIIIPAHNSEAYIRKALDSIENQSFKDYELIVICDNCTDNTYNIAKEYTYKVYESDFGSTGLSRSKGLDEAEGDYVLFMDDDDWWLHEFVLQQISDVIDHHPEEDLVQFGFIWKYKGYYGPYKLPKGQIYSNVWSKCFKRSFIGDTRFKDIYYGDDAEFVGEILKKKPRIVYYDMPIYYYNWLREGSITDNEVKAGTLEDTLNKFKK